MAIDPQAMYDTPQAETYENYVRENWEKLAPWEQRQAREFLVGSKHPGRVGPPTATLVGSPQTFLNEVQNDNGHPELVWTIRAGWVCIFATLLLSPFLFGIIGVGVGFYNAKKGETELGIL